MNAPIGGGSGGPAAGPCDLTQDGSLDENDVELSVDMALGLSPCQANIIEPGICDVVVTQRVVNAVLGESCLQGPSGPGGDPKEVLLRWTASSSPGVIGNNVYRSTTPGGGYSKVNGSLVTSNQYTDTSVNGGQTYYYVVTAVATGNMESGFSNEAAASVPQ